MDRLAHLNDALAGHYRLERELGSGGMATVYLAEDVRHHRQVAIKVLRDDVSASVGADRFLREIEIAAQLQHPHILPLLDSGDADGRLFYVMPFVEGQSLRARLAREHELPIGDAVRLLIEIVDGLAYAHTKGVVHRDIKPDNIMLTGRHALIADFGVARALSTATGGSSSLTSLGVALGTPSYMSPEQATADPHVDQRTDLYSVGVMAYELLAGTLPFAATSPQKVLAAHVMETPAPLSKHRPGIALALEQAVMRCLEKKPADRWQSADELLAALEPLATPSGGLAPTSARLQPAERGSRTPLLVGAVFVALLGGGVAYMRTRPTGPTLALGHAEQLTTDAGLQIHPAISPDGKLVAYSAGSAVKLRIFIRPVAGGRIIPLSDDTTATQTSPRWSPDGTQLLYLANGGVSVSPSLGGSSRPVASAIATNRIATADWSPDGKQIAFARGDSIYVQALEGTLVRAVGKSGGLTDCHWSPSGELLACVQGNTSGFFPGRLFGNAAPSAVVVIALQSGTTYNITDPSARSSSPVWSRDSRRLFFVSARDGTRDVYEMALASDGQPSGKPMRLTTGLGVHSMSLDKDGKHLAYSVFSSKANIWGLPIPATGSVSADNAVPLTTGTQVVEYARVSRDGQWLLYDATRNGSANIYRIPAGGGPEEQLTHESFDVFAPDLSPDGKLVAYHSWRKNTRDIEVKPLDGGPVEFVATSTLQESYPRWSPDGHRLVFYSQSAGVPMFVAERASAGKWSEPRRIGAGVRPSWSPDGTKILATSSDQRTLFLMTPSGTTTTLSSSLVDERGEPLLFESPLFSPDGKSIYFKTHDRAGAAAIWSIPFTGGKPTLRVSFPSPLKRSNRSDFAVDAKRFYFTFEEQQSNVWVAEVGKP